MAPRRVCRIDDLPPGGRKIVDGGRRGLGLFNVGGTVVALSNYCPHAGAPVCRGGVTGTTESERRYEAKWVRQGEILRCPWHGWEFELKTGRSITRPFRSVQTYQVTVEEGWIVVDD